jgi:hypothetical protein
VVKTGVIQRFQHICGAKAIIRYEKEISELIIVSNDYQFSEPAVCPGNVGDILRVLGDLKKVS